MPKIIGQAEQMQAMKDIKAALKDMGVINKFLETENPSGEYTVSFKGPDGKVLTTTIHTSEKHVFDDLIKAYKHEVGESMLKLAQDHRIELDQKERDIFGI